MFFAEEPQAKTSNSVRWFEWLHIFNQSNGLQTKAVHCFETPSEVRVPAIWLAQSDCNPTSQMTAVIRTVTVRHTACQLADEIVRMAACTQLVNIETGKYLCTKDRLQPNHMDPCMDSMATLPANASRDLTGSMMHESVRCLWKFIESRWNGSD